MSWKLSVVICICGFHDTGWLPSGRLPSGHLNAYPRCTLRGPSPYFLVGIFLFILQPWQSEISSYLPTLFHSSKSFRGSIWNCLNWPTQINQDTWLVSHSFFQTIIAIHCACSIIISSKCVSNLSNFFTLPLLNRHYMQLWNRSMWLYLKINHT